MTCTPFGALVGSGVPTLVPGVGSTAVAMGAMCFGLLAASALLIVLARWWSAP